MGIVVPARDEEARIGACLHALRVAVAVLPPEVRCLVCVVLDRCRDTTGLVLRDVLAEHPAPVEVVRNHRARTVGELRDLGLRRLLGRLAPVPETRTWLLSTDADSTVPPGWVSGHLHHADAGADAVAGTVTLAEPVPDRPQDPADRLVRRRHAAVFDAGVNAGVHHRGLTHSHVYAANLGVRASAYTGVGGFPAVTPGEDHALLARLRRAGHPVACPVEPRVTTSARLDGRADGGLATLLRQLRAGTPPEAPAR